MPTASPAAELIVIDVGNSRVKLGRFLAAGDCAERPSEGLLPIAPPRLPEPDETLGASIEALEAGELAAWLDQIAPTAARVVVGTVTRPVAERLIVCMEKWFAEHAIPCQVEFLSSEKIPIPTRVDEPARVGVDRLAAALAASRLCKPDAPAIVIDVGTAITVDLVAADGVFEGGAILPGVRMAARALDEQTDALPRSELTELDASPNPVGKRTESAIYAGLFWGAVGAIRELIDRQRDGLTLAPQVFLTGGAAPSIARLIGGPDYSVKHVAHLTLSGLAIATAELDEAS